MASLFRPTVSTYALPNGKHRTPDGNRVTKSTPGAVKTSHLSEIWYGRFKDAAGITHRVKLTANKTASQQMLAGYVTDAARGKVGVRDPFAEHGKASLASHIEDFKRHLRTTTNKHGRKNTADHVQVTLARVQAVFDGCGFERLRDINSTRVETFLYDLHEVSGLSKQSCNHHLQCVKQFCKWADDDDRLAKNPLVKLKKESVEDDPRHKRRAFLTDELPWIFSVTGKSTVIFRGLSGEDRATLYAVALATGFRVRELSNLTPSNFDLARATVNLDGRFTKNRKPVVDRPIPQDLARFLSTYLADRSADTAIWSGRWSDRASNMVKGDLAEARKAWLDDAEHEQERAKRTESNFLRYKDSAGRFADMHAWRHSFCSLLVSSGVNSKLAMELARHSSLELTLGRYSHIERQEMVDAVGRMSEFMPLSATGTDGSVVLRLDRALTKTLIAPGVRLMTHEETYPTAANDQNVMKTAEKTTKDSDCGLMMTDDETRDPMDSCPRQMVYETGDGESGYLVVIDRHADRVGSEGRRSARRQVAAQFGSKSWAFE